MGNLSVVYQLDFFLWHSLLGTVYNGLHTAAF